MSDSLQPHGPQQARLPCPSQTPEACSNSCPLSQWCYPTISSSVVPFPSCLQFFPASGSFQMVQLFVSGGQSIGASASTSVKLGLFKCSLYSVKWTMTMCIFLWILMNGPRYVSTTPETLSEPSPFIKIPSCFFEVRPPLNNRSYEFCLHGFALFRGGCKHNHKGCSLFNYVHTLVHLSNL